MGSGFSCSLLSSKSEQWFCGSQPWLLIRITLESFWKFQWHQNPWARAYEIESFFKGGLNMQPGSGRTTLQIFMAQILTLGWTLHELESFKKYGCLCPASEILMSLAGHLGSQRGRDIGRGKLILSLWRARIRTQSQDLGIMPWAKGRRSTTEPPRCPKFHFFKRYPVIPISASSIQVSLDKY